MKTNITRATLKNLRPKAKPYNLVDEKQPGLILRVQPSGAATWYCRYGFRETDSQSRRQTQMKLGTVAEINPDDARKKCRKILGEVAGGKDPAAERRRNAPFSLGQFVEGEYTKHIRNRKSGDATLARLRACFLWLWDKRLTAIRADKVGKWVDDRLDSGTSALTVARDVAALRAVLSLAVKSGRLKSHPLEGFKLEKAKNGSRVRFLRHDEEQRLFRALRDREEQLRVDRDSANTWRRERGYDELPDLRAVEYGDHLRPMVELTMFTGLRRGEMFGLEWRDVDFQTRSLHVRGEISKSGKERRIPLSETAYGTLKAWQAQTAGDAFVFASPKTGGKFDNINNSWNALTKAAGIDDFRWHDLRHDFASKLAMAGIPLFNIQELLGHSDPRMTLIYSHLSPEHQAEAVRALDARKAAIDDTLAFPKEQSSRRSGG